MAGARHDDGKRALFSTATRRPGTVVVECEHCHGRTRLTYAELGRAMMPLTLWAPWRRHSRLAACPACSTRTWLRVFWTA